MTGLVVTDTIAWELFTPDYFECLLFQSLDMPEYGVHNLKESMVV
jgi:hypothetical protein